MKEEVLNYSPHETEYKNILMKLSPKMDSNTGIFICSKSFEDVLQFKCQGIARKYINMVRDDICRRKHSENVSDCSRPFGNCVSPLCCPEI
jgi:hypothetical protein